MLLEPDESGVQRTVAVSARVALARCDRCGSRFRVLPCDAQPRKTYGLALIEHEVWAYSRGDRSLRQVAWSQLGDRAPAHTTLHGWTEGLGAHALGRRGGDLGGAPMSRLLGEAEPRVPEIAGLLRSKSVPDPRRYRSEARRDRLAAVITTMTAAPILTDVSHPHAMAECRRLSLSWSNVSALEFPSRFLRTAIEHRDRSKPRRSCSSSRRTRDRCPTRTRSPPDASSRSHS